MFAIGVAAHLDSRTDVELPVLEEKSIWTNGNGSMDYWLLPNLARHFVWSYSRQLVIGSSWLEFIC